MMDKKIARRFLGEFNANMYDILYDGDYSPPVKYGLDLSNGENPLGCSPKISGAIEKSFNKMSAYPEGQYRGLVTALSKVHKKEEDCFVVTAGSNGALLACVATYVQKGDTLLMPALAFPTPAMEAKVRGGRAIAVPVQDNLHVDLVALANSVTEDTKLIYLSNPNNPTGLYLPPREIRDFARHVKVPVVVSEANVEYVGESVMDADDVPENLISARSFSKAYGLAGLRVGYAMCSPQRAKDILKKLSPNMVSTLSQAAAQAALEDQDHLDKSVKYMASEREYLSKQLDKVGFRVLESQANNILALIPDSLENSTFLARALAARDCSIVDGASFPGLSNRCIRIVPRVRDVNDKFIGLCQDIIGTVPREGSPKSPSIVP